MASGEMADRPQRSVFVGNIPYEVTEEKLKEIFSEAGKVLSLKLVYDRETGKPKGYGFCEYKDVETAAIAMKHLNGYEINGRVLRVDNAGAERSAEMQQGGPPMNDNPTHPPMGHPHHQQPHPNQTQHQQHRVDEPIGPERAPEAISQAVASLPPEQMYEMMKQMKACIQNNPNDARNMLLQNPQLAYALLQAQVVMKIIDPSVALSMLHKDNHLGGMGLLPEGQQGFPPPHMGMPPPHQHPSQMENPWINAGAGVVMPPNPPGPFGGMPGPGDLDLRQMDPRLRGPPQDFDLRDPRRDFPNPMPMDPRNRGDRDMRGGGGQDRDMRDMNKIPADPRSRGRGGGAQPATSTTGSGAIPSSSVESASKLFPQGMAGLGPQATDQEKAALIMQVLQLSDEQIAVFPPEQRSSILLLKEQISKSTNR